MTTSPVYEPSPGGSDLMLKTFLFAVIESVPGSGSSASFGVTRYVPFSQPKSWASLQRRRPQTSSAQSNAAIIPATTPVRRSLVFTLDSARPPLLRGHRASVRGLVLRRARYLRVMPRVGD